MGQVTTSRSWASSFCSAVRESLIHLDPVFAAPVGQHIRVIRVWMPTWFQNDAISSRFLSKVVPCRRCTSRLILRRIFGWTHGKCNGVANSTNQEESPRNRRVRKKGRRRRHRNHHDARPPIALTGTRPMGRPRIAIPPTLHSPRVGHATRDDSHPAVRDRTRPPAQRPTARDRPTAVDLPP